MTIRPIFLFSLPRSGSTLLQRMLAAHPAIATASEPWILLPLIYSIRSSGIHTEYGQRTAVGAIEDFAKLLPNGMESYGTAIHDLALRLYGEAAPPGVEYFVDKTPRYSLVASEIIDLFPEGRFIFLWRNPLAIAASIVETWGKGNWNLHHYEPDLYRGLPHLLLTSREHSSRAVSLRYEDLILQPEQVMRSVLQDLGLPWNPQVISGFSQVQLSGRVGDQIGATTYRDLSKEPLEKWTGVFNNPLRRRWARRYVGWLGADRLEQMGYDRDSLLTSLDQNPLGWTRMFNDAVRMVYGHLHVGANRMVLEHRRARWIGRLRRLTAR